MKNGIGPGMRLALHDHFKSAIEGKISGDGGRFMDLISISKGGMKIEDIKVHRTPKGNWAVEEKGKNLMTIGKEQLSEKEAKDLGILEINKGKITLETSIGKDDVVVLNADLWINEDSGKVFIDNGKGKGPDQEKNMFIAEAKDGLTAIKSGKFKDISFRTDDDFEVKIKPEWIKKI